MIIHILVDTSQVETQDEYITVTVDIIILSCSIQIYLHLLHHLQVHNVQTFIKTFKLY